MFIQQNCKVLIFATAMLGLSTIFILRSHLSAAEDKNSSKQMVEDFSGETVGAEPASFVPAVGNWLIGTDGSNKVLVVDGRKWSEGQAAAGLADKARAIYGERYAEFLDNVKAYAYFPFAVFKDLQDFKEGEISLRFKPIAGRIDQGGGILFNLKPNGDYLLVRANALETISYCSNTRRANARASSGSATRRPRAGSGKSESQYQRSESRGLVERQARS